MRQFYCIAAIFAVGCFHPDPEDGKLLCGSDSSCPSGYACAQDLRCYRHPPDLAMSLEDMAIADLGGSVSDLSSGDLSVADLSVEVVTANDINTGKVSPGRLVTVENLVLTGPMAITSINLAMLKCRYQGFLQDPSGVAPNGLQIFIALSNCAPYDGGCTCPAVGMTGQPLDELTTIGDVFTLTGVYQPFGTAHELASIAQATKTGSGRTVNPIAIQDPTPFAPTGTGYVGYESMLVEIQPTSPFAIGAIDGKGNFSGAGVAFSGFYSPVYGAGGTFPAVGSTWHAIAGIAYNDNGTNSVIPRVMSDFVP
jgi:hypothetical protein